MKQKEVFAFIAAFLAEQTESEPDTQRVPRQRLAALARNPVGMTVDEIAALLTSPTTRASFNKIRKASGVPANDDYIFRVESFAAGSNSPDSLNLRFDFCSLTLRPGPDDEVPYVLELRLKADTPGGMKSRHVMVWETKSNQVWLDGITDEEGELLSTWALGTARPRDRLQNDNELCFALI